VKTGKNSDESDFDIEEFDSLKKTLKSDESNSQEFGARPRRATANRKALVISDDEDAESGSFIVEMEEIEEEEECSFLGKNFRIK